MDEFIARQNVKHFRECLWSESDPEMRARLEKLLIAEEDKLAKDMALLTDVDRHLADGNHRIERQRMVVSDIERGGRNGLQAARTLLDGLIESQRLMTHYRERTLTAIRENRL